MAKSLDIIKTGAARKPAVPTVRRDSLVIGDVYAVKDRHFMHTGVRTNPPSTGGNGRVVGYQSIIVKGNVKDGSDGAAFTTKGDKQVVLVGKAEVTVYPNA